ncbi:fasciclin-like arabinogalactan protein 3 [Phragmites australis]|uniref:fasciclin-like arabinogalactan protein 3 n=1 Tax=Phragmites australis TaxID=29695 RepID=UPI002D791A1C|nr:fasciclin-like arabinogalactan protein 3 [Phragmites australis]
MASKILLPLLLLLAAASPAALAAFDALQMLADKPKYGTFSKLLAQTKVAEEAGQLRSASLLVVTDKAAKPLASLAADKLRSAVANHVLLNYFDPIKLDEMRTRTALLPTLLSTTDKRLGFVNYSRADDGQMYLGAPGAPCIAKLVKVVAARPYSVSIMEVSKPILPPGFGDPVPAPGRRAKGGKAKIKPSASGLDESKIAAPGQAAGATGEVFPDNPGFAPVAAPK